MSVLPPFELHRPRSLDDALERLSFDDVPYAGGTELLVAMRTGLLHPRSLVDLKAIPDLRGVDEDGDMLLIGATTTHRSVAAHDVVVRRLPILARVLDRVGNPRVRSTGTVGGNLCFAEPKSDVATILIALEASLTLASPRGTRETDMTQFAVGPYATDRGDDEILVDIRIPVTDRTVVYEKFQTQERPTAGVAGTRRADGSVMIVVGAVGGMPEVVTDPADGRSAASSIEVIPDMSGSEDYKRHVVSVFVDRVLRRLETEAA